MFTRSLVIQKQIEDLQLGVESYQKKINVTKPETTKSGIRKRDPYTPYQDPQGFIYVDTLGQNRLMRPDELYKFSDRTLTGLRTSLDDITKNMPNAQNWRDLPRDIPLDRVEVLGSILTDSKEYYKDGDVENFTGRIKGMHVFIGNFIYVIDFMIVEDISLIIDPRLSQVVLGKPFVEISNMTNDPPEGVVRFTNMIDEISYKMPHKIEQYNSLSDLEREHTKSVYLRNEEDKRKGVEYAMSKILGFYKECLELGPEYLTGIADKRGIT
ncbi:hypothetical protein Tco_0011508 [Tanacetum coccineum]